MSFLTSLRRRWQRPVIRCQATVCEKRTASSYGHYDGVACFVIFEIEGEQQELALVPELYATLQLGQKGMLTYQGGKARNFEALTSADGASATPGGGL